MTEALLILAVLVLVAVNGFFVAAEFALVRSRRSRLEQTEEEGDAASELVLEEIEKIDEYLSACQVGITLASIAIGFLGEPAVASLLEEPLGAVAGHGVAVAIALTLSYFLVTVAHITAGEQVPKIYAITHAEGTARRLARPLEWFRVAAKPFITLVNGISNAMLRALRVDPRAEFEEPTRSEDLKILIAQGMTGGTLDPGEAVMLHGVFHLHEQEARQVMTPIPAVVTTDVSEDVETALRRCISSGHTRLVVTE